MSFLLQTVIVIFSVLLAGQISRRLGQPSVLGQLLVGVLVGPALLGWVQPTPIIKELAEVGVVMLMFMAGLETSVGDIRKALWPATLVAVCGVALPFAGGWGLAAAWGYAGSTSVFIGVLLVATSVSISAQTLRELGQLQTRPGVIILAAAVLDDVLGLLVLSAVMSTLGGGVAAHGADSPALLLAKVLSFFAVAGLVGWKLLPPIVRWVSRFEAGTAVLATGIAVAMAYAYGAEAAGLAGIVGAYVTGLMLSLTEFRGRLMHEVEHTAFAFFVPFFFVSVGLSARFAGLSLTFAVFVVLLTVVAVLTKWLGGGLGAVLGGLVGPPGDRRRCRHGRTRRSWIDCGRHRFGTGPALRGTVHSHGDCHVANHPRDSTAAEVHFPHVQPVAEARYGGRKHRLGLDTPPAYKPPA